MRTNCYVCLRPEVACLCHSIKAFDTNAQFVFLMHPKELKKEKAATGRLTHLSLTNSMVFDGVNFTDHEKLNQLIHHPQNFVVVLYPGDEAKNLSHGEFYHDEVKHKKLVIIVIDGTWATAKKMMKLSLNLHSLPRLCFTPEKPSEFLIKQQPHELCLSTIESVHMLIQNLKSLKFEQCEGEDVLLTLFRQMRDFQLKCASDPNRAGYRRGNYKLPSERRPPKMTGRKLFFEEKNFISLISSEADDNDCKVPTQE